MSSCQPGIEETDLIEEQVDFWNEGSSIDLQDESRYGTSIKVVHFTSIKFCSYMLPTFCKVCSAVVY
jgi:hypothetical protein